MPVEIKRLSAKADLRTFIHLPAEIHKGHKNWLPPVYVDDWAFFSPEKNRAFRYSDTVLALAYRDQRPMGRIMGIINQKYNELKGEKTARFGFLECYNDPEIARALLDYVEHWAAEKGMSCIVGPYGFSDKDPQGLMIEGFEYPPVIAAPCNEPYLVELVEKQGYSKEVDCLMFRYDLSKELPGIYRRIFDRVSARPEYKLLEFTRKRDLRPYVIPILRMVNEAYNDIYGFQPLEEDEMKDLYKRYMPVIDPRFVKVILSSGEVVAFIIGLPSLTRGIQKAKGRLNPWGLLQLVLASKRTRQLDLMLGGVRPDHQGRGLEVLMAMPLLNSAKDAGFKNFEIHLVLETNRPMLAEMNRTGAEAHKRFRVYRKEL